MAWHKHLKYYTIALYKKAKSHFTGKTELEYINSKIEEFKRPLLEAYGCSYKHITKVSAASQFNKPNNAEFVSLSKFSSSDYMLPNEKLMYLLQNGIDYIGQSNRFVSKKGLVAEINGKFDAAKLLGLGVKTTVGGFKINAGASLEVGLGLGFKLSKTNIFTVEYLNDGSYLRSGSKLMNRYCRFPVIVCVYGGLEKKMSLALSAEAGFKIAAKMTTHNKKIEHTINDEFCDLACEATGFGVKGEIGYKGSYNYAGTSFNYVNLIPIFYFVRDIATNDPRSIMQEISKITDSYFNEQCFEHRLQNIKNLANYDTKYILKDEINVAHMVGFINDTGTAHKVGLKIEATAGLGALNYHNLINVKGSLIGVSVALEKSMCAKWRTVAYRLETPLRGNVTLSNSVMIKYKKMAFDPICLAVSINTLDICTSIFKKKSTWANEKEEFSVKKATFNFKDGANVLSLDSKMVSAQEKLNKRLSYAKDKTVDWKWTKELLKAGNGNINSMSYVSGISYFDEENDALLTGSGIIHGQSISLTSIMQYLELRRYIFDSNNNANVNDIILNKGILQSTLSIIVPIAEKFYKLSNKNKNFNALLHQAIKSLSASYIPDLVTFKKSTDTGFFTRRLVIKEVDNVIIAYHQAYANFKKINFSKSNTLTLEDCISHISQYVSLRQSLLEMMESACCNWMIAKNNENVDILNHERWKGIDDLFESIRKDKLMIEPFGCFVFYKKLKECRKFLLALADELLIDSKYLIAFLGNNQVKDTLVSMALDPVCNPQAFLIEVSYKIDKNALPCQGVCKSISKSSPDRQKVVGKPNQYVEEHISCMNNASRKSQPQGIFLRYRKADAYAHKSTLFKLGFDFGPAEADIQISYEKSFNNDAVILIARHYFEDFSIAEGDHLPYKAVPVVRLMTE
jgi:hypothetical protein